MPQTTNSEIPLEIDGEVIYLDPNFAEGKALKRINHPIPEDEWITVGEIGQETDLQTVREKIRQRGYKIEVSSETLSPSN